MKTRAGIIVVMVLVILLLIEGMVAGMLALATHTRATATAQLRNARAEAAAYFAAQSTLKGWSASRFDTLAVGALIPAAQGSGSDADAWWATTVERLSSQFVMRSEARVGGPLAYSRARVLAVARTLDRDAVLTDLAAALASRDQAVMAGVATIDAQDTLCSIPTPRPGPAALITTVTPFIATSVTTTGPIVVDSTLKWLDSLALGNATWSDIAAIADRAELGTVTPQPVTQAGTCDTTAWANWGDPLQAGAGCSGYFPLVFSAGDLTISGGYGQGLLVVAGMLTMNGGASFTGGIVARDGLVIGPHARVRGAVFARSGYALVDDAQIVHSQCALTNALAAMASARRLMPQRRRFLPVF